jgi:hypothetical protein
MSAVVGARPWEYDPKTVERDWNEELARGGKEGKRCFAVMWTDGLVRPHPPIERGMKECVEKLRAAGHEGALLLSLSFLPFRYPALRDLRPDSETAVLTLTSTFSHRLEPSRPRRRARDRFSHLRRR